MPMFACFFGRVTIEMKRHVVAVVTSQECCCTSNMGGAVLLLNASIWDMRNHYKYSLPFPWKRLICEYTKDVRCPVCEVP